MQLLEAPQKPHFTAPAILDLHPIPYDEAGRAREVVKLATNLTPEAKRLLDQVADKNPKLAEITAETAQRLH